MVSESNNDKSGTVAGEPVRVRALIPYPYAGGDGEIDLVDVGASLWRRWQLMLGVFLLCLLAGFLIAFFAPRSFEYTTTIEIGSRVVGAQVQPIESADSAASKLQKGYLPQVVTRYSQAHHLDPRQFSFHVEAPAQANLVIISGRGRREQADHFKAIEKAAARLLVASDARVIKNQQAQLSAQVAKAAASLAQLKNPENKKLLQTEAENLRHYAKQARQQQIASSGDNDRASGAMSQLLLNTQVQQAIERLTTVQQQLNNLPSKIASQAAAVKSLRTQLDNIQLTRIVAGPIRSIEPAGLSRTVTVIIGVVAGVILALLIAGCANYAAAVRRRLARPEAPSES